MGLQKNKQADPKLESNSGLTGSKNNSNDENLECQIAFRDRGGVDWRNEEVQIGYGSK